ncbi:unnamed protein product [Leuciscus chuanchicus]
MAMGYMVHLLLPGRLSNKSTVRYDFCPVVVTTETVCCHPSRSESLRIMGYYLMCDAQQLTKAPTVKDSPDMHREPLQGPVPVSHCFSSSALNFTPRTRPQKHTTLHEKQNQSLSLVLSDFLFKQPEAKSI